MANKLIQVKASGMMCSFCTMSVEKALKRLDGVKNVQVNLVHGIILVEGDPARVAQDQVAKKVEELGYTVVATEAQQVSTDEAIFSTIKRRGFLAMGLAVADLLFDPLDLFGAPGRVRAVVSGLVAAVVLLWVGYPILRKTLMAVGQRVVNANVLLSAGAWGAFGIGVAHLFAPAGWPNFFPVAIWLMALHLFFGYFKLGTRKAAAESVRRLLALQAERARVVRGGREVEVPVEEVQPGEAVLVRPGERVPLDGVVREGASSLDLSTVTGESAPVYREVGEEVVGGTINLDGFLRVEVLRPASESYIAQVVRLMRHIEEKKPPIQLLMDRLMNYYGPVVFAVAALAAAGWLLHSGEVSTAVLIGLTTLIMGYPCALGITTPMVLAIGGGHGIARGLLVRAGEFFQSLAEVDTVAFDKTGTLTYGRPTVREVIAVRGSADEVLATVAAAEKRSEHPLAGAILRYAVMREVRFPASADFRAVPGRGVQATVDGRRVLVGRRSFLAAEGVSPGGEGADHAARLEAEGHTVVYAAADGEMIGAVALQDVPRPGTERAIRRLRELGIRSVLLTGDNRPVAEAIARQVGIDEVRAELLPEQKVEAIERLQAEGRTVAMVGDGINDAPALVQSDVGIALGAGTDVAMESAGVVLVSDRMEKVVSAILLGRASHRKMKQNIGIAVAANVIGITLAIAGWITAPVAIAIMTASILAVLLSTLSLLRLRLEVPEAAEEAVVEAVIPARRMHCDSCARKIDRKLSRARGVRFVAADAARKEVRVAYRPDETTEDALRQQLEEMGFR
ncbi:MAG TPA: heavy metal translocating P-type ATPase [Longimicrobiaceae bacterium]|nr:heavy metal translocating P-type ATPase [Longimicrobiaceae bacterium]